MCVCTCTWGGLLDDPDYELCAGVQVAHLADVVQRRLYVPAACLLQSAHRHLLHTHGHITAGILMYGQIRQKH